ncbi:MAG: hypothetical protein JWN27_1548 [Candidatus Eremiobacteraeota bacterium]|nr:hypothetical protein [Candidatus Eremiobacteraeota bacterium]
MPAAAPSEIKGVPAKAWEGLMKLYEAGGVEKAVEPPSTEVLDSQAMIALKRLGIIKVVKEPVRGPHGNRGTVKVLVPKEQVRKSVRGTGEGASTAPKPRKPGVAGNLSIDAIKRFVKDYEEAIVAKRGESAKAITEKIAECRKAVAAAKDDDEADLAAKRLRDAIEEKRTLEVGLSAAVIRDMRRHIETPLKPVLAAMLPE